MHLSSDPPPRSPDANAAGLIGSAEPAGPSEDFGPESGSGMSASASGRTLTSEALAEGFEGCARLLWCVAAGVLNDRSGIEDVLQEAVVVALTKRASFVPGTRLDQWLARIVKLTAFNHARRFQKSSAMVDVHAIEVVEHAAEPRGGGRPGPRGTLEPDQNAFDDHVSAALHELDDTARVCLLMRTTCDLPYRRIALALDIPEGTAMSHVSRARKTLRSRLIEAGWSKDGRHPGVGGGRTNRADQQGRKERDQDV